MTLRSKYQMELCEAEAKLKALDKYPDLAERKNKCGRVTLTSDHIITNASKFEVQYECECCDGVNAWAVAYDDFQGIRIYSKTRARIGKRYTNGSIQLNEYWSDNLYDTGCSDTLHSEFRKWAKKNCEGFDDDD